MGLVVVVVASVKGVKGSQLFRLSNQNGHIITIGDKAVPSMHISYGHMTTRCTNANCGYVSFVCCHGW